MALRKPMPTYAELQARVEDLERRLSQAFSVEEMDVLREQLVERAERAEAKSEALEWRVRTELRRASAALSSVFDDDEESTEVRLPTHRMLQ